MQYFNIQVASQLSGVASATIRAWEKRYNAVVPDRAENKHRLYSETDIAKLALLFKLTELGQSIGKIAHLSLNELKDIYESLMHKPYDEKVVALAPLSKSEIDSILNSFFLALAAYKIDIITHELQKAKEVLSPRSLCLEIIVPLFREIGKRVISGELTIAQEHTISALVRFYMGQMIGQHYQKNLQRDDLVLITTPEGEMHEIGILGAALICVHYGVRFIYLGTNLPAESLAEAANALNPKAILLGSTRFELHNNLSLEDYIKTFKEHAKVPSALWVGGNFKPFLKSDLEKKKIIFFPSLESLDTFLADF
jgi:DNA-binding transcriptional MerR regulator